MWLSYPLTVLIIITIINTINFIGYPFYSMIYFATASVFVPFFYYNVFGDLYLQKISSWATSVASRSDSSSVS